MKLNNKTDLDVASLVGVEIGDEDQPVVGEVYVAVHWNFLHLH